MKSLNIVKGAGMILFALFLSQTVNAQSGSPSQAGSKPDKVVQELLSEVHQLRVVMQQMSVNAYRGQIMVERLRLQQEHLGRLIRELQEVRSVISELKANEPLAKERVDDAEIQFERGVLPDLQLKEIRAGLGDIKRRHQNMTEREVVLANEVEQERTKLAEINQRLDALEREVMLTGLANEEKKKSKN